MLKQETECLVKYLTDDDVFFEWGAGGSTINFPILVKEYFSVENNYEWFNKTIESLNKKNISNAHVYYKKIHDLKYDDHLDNESQNLLKLTNNVQFKDGKYYAIMRGEPIDWHCYIDYVNAISLPNKKFSKVFVDGRARVFCAYKALNYLTEDGIVFIHDFLRPRYHSVLDYYTKIDQVDSLIVLKKK